MSDTPTLEALRQCRDALSVALDLAIEQQNNLTNTLGDRLPHRHAAAQRDTETVRAALAAADAALASPAGEPTVPSAAVLLAEQVLHMDMVTDRGLRARDLARQVLDNAHDIHEGECAEVLRSIASYLGAGGYNATAVDAAVFREKIMWGIEQINGQQPTPAALSVPALVADKWEGAEEWMPLAWELCADECGEDACNELVWEGGPVPEPWGDRWLKYEGEAKRLIALVRKHVPGVAPPPPAPVPAVPPGWAFYTADFSMKAHETAPVGHAMLVRTGDDFRAWFTLSDEDRDRIPLYIQGAGPTIQEAIAEACKAALSAHNITGAPDHG